MTFGPPPGAQHAERERALQEKFHYGFIIIADSILPVLPSARNE